MEDLSTDMEASSQTPPAADPLRRKAQRLPFQCFTLLVLCYLFSPARLPAGKALSDAALEKLIETNRYYVSLYPGSPRNYKSILPLINNYHSITNQKLKGTAAYVLGHYYMHVSDSENALKFFNESRSLYRKTGQWGKYLNATKHFCNLSRMAGNSGIVVPTMKECLEIAQKHDVGFYILDPLHELAIHLSYEDQNYSESAKYGKMFLDTLRKYQKLGVKDPDFDFNQTIDLEFLYLELGHSYTFLGELNKAAFYLQKAEKAFQGTNKYGRLARLYKYKTLLFSFLNKPDSLVSNAQKFSYYEREQNLVRSARLYQLPRFTRELNSLSEAYWRSKEEVQQLTQQTYYATAGFTLSVVLAGLILWLHLKSKTNQSRINELLKKDFKRSQELNEEKSKYFSILSHELRTPIFAITGLARLMNDPANQTKENFEAIINSGNHLLHLVNNVLQHHKLEESASVALDEQDFYLAQTLKEVQQTTSFLASQKDIRVVFYNPVNIGHHLHGDNQKLAQVLVNLVSNAIRYSHRNGLVEVSVKLTGSDADTRTFHFSVRDHGIGIEQADIPTLFDYRKTSYDTNREQEANLKGMGIGLFIVARFISSMAGEIHVASEPGKGSDFHFSLSFKTGRIAPAASKPLLRIKKNFTVLVVDDIKINLIVSQKTITALGLHCITATDSDPVVDIVQNESVDLVLMDLNMPLIDGYELSRKIRQAGSSIPIIAHTAVVKENIDHDALAAAEISDFLVKPYSNEEIKSVFTRYLGIEF